MTTIQAVQAGDWRGVRGFLDPISQVRFDHVCRAWREATKPAERLESIQRMPWHPMRVTYGHLVFGKVDEVERTYRELMGLKESPCGRDYFQEMVAWRSLPPPAPPPAAPALVLYRDVEGRLALRSYNPAAEDVEAEMKAAVEAMCLVKAHSDKILRALEDREFDAVLPTFCLTLERVLGQVVELFPAEVRFLG